MKTLFIPAKSKITVDENTVNEISKRLPKNLAIAYSIQYKNLAEKIKKILSKNHNVNFFTQVLGCSKPKFPKNIQAILLISDGKFHAVSLAYETSLPVFIFSNNKLHEISQEETKKISAQKKTAYLKYLHADSVGVLISTKPGQSRFADALKLKNRLKNKKVYFFISDLINPAEFQNFKIDSWINTACSRLDFDNSIINVSDVRVL